MNVNKLINAAFIDRAAYETIKKYTEGNFEGLADVVWTEIDGYYCHDKDAKSCDQDIIIARVAKKYPKLESSVETLFNSFSEISIPNLLSYLADYKRNEVGMEISGALLSDDPVTAIDLFDKYQQYVAGNLDAPVTEEEADIFIDSDIDDIVESYSPDNLIKVYPKSLNERIGGGVPRGTNIAIFARPETGKSLVAINMAAGFCRDGWKTLYIGNEDPHEEMRLRLIGRMSGYHKWDILADRAGAIQEARSKGYQNLIFASAKPSSIPEIEKLVREYSPDVVIVDQLRNVDIPKVEGLTVKLEMAAQMIRNLGKKYGFLSVQITQAGATAANKLVLTMDDVDSSKTGFPAAFDIMIGVGMDDMYEAQGKRMFSLCKNKPGNNHDYFPVKIDKSISKVITI